jgi:two-component system NtrC family sensor kinase
MAKTTRKTGKRATAAGRGELRARKAAVAKTHDAKLHKLKPARPGPRKGKPSLPLETASLKRQLKTARLQQQASAEILRAVANASGDVARPLRQIAETTARLFGAPSVSIQLAEGGQFTQEYRVGAIAQRIGSAYPRSNIRVGGRNLPGTVVFDNRQIHIPDLDRLDPSMSDFPGLPHARAGGARTVCGTPLRCEGKAIGALIIFRNRLLPFTDDELALQQSFADQAVIAIENARLFNNTQEALARQTASADILRVISQSPTDVQPVFDAIALAAVRLLGCERAFIQRCDGASFWTVSWCGPEGQLPILNASPIPIDPEANFPSRAISENRTLHLPDWSAIDLPEFEREIQKRLGINSALYMPLRREGECIGLLAMAGKRTNIFGASEIALAESFRDQAVIAIENTRLFNETKEALGRQTATADVLRIISRSVAHAAPVFDTILESCERLFNPYDAAVYLVEADRVRGVARRGPGAGDWGADSMPLEGSSTGVAIAQGRPVHFPDLADKADLPEDKRTVLKETGGMTVLYAPMISQDSGVGSLVVTRRPKKPFTEAEIGLVQTFADQAVIAIENARLFNETKEALERQTATADILKVIASSPSDVQPVFDAIAASAKKLIGGFSAVVQRFIGDELHLAAFTPTNPEADATLQASFPTPISRFPVFLLVRDGKTVEFTDTEAEDVPQLNRDLARLRGYRSMLFTPLMNNGAPIGMISVTRKEPGSFADHHVQLVRTFADQAVIAIENVRLFDEVKAKTADLSESLQQQIATADVLKVISRSAFDLQAVLTTLVRSALDLCNAPIGTFFLREGDVLRLATQVGCTAELVQYFHDNPIPLNQSSGAGRAFSTGRVVHFPDVLADPDYRLSEVQRLGDYRSLLAVPLLREQETIGVFSLSRTRPEPFSQRQIDLVTTFADQAVIAIENVRLFDEVQAKTRDLTEALTYQTGSGNILKAIASSPTDVGPVLAAIAENAAELCDAYDAAVLLKVGDDLHFSAHHGSIPIGLERWPINRNWTAGRAFLDQKPVHIHDLRADENSDFSDGRELSLRMGHRSILSVPLLRENDSIGAIVLRRKEVHPFSDKQIALLQTFADQAVIAISNVRLFEQVQERTRELSQSLDELRTAQDRLVQTEKLASLGQLTAGIAHEIKNPLNFVNNFSALSAELIDELDETLAPAPLDQKMRGDVGELTQMLKSNLEKVVQHGKRADSIVKNMLLHSREGSGEQRPADINALLDESLNLAYHGARAEKPEFNITLRRDLDPDAGTINVFPQEITRVFINLISNGFYAASKRKAENGEADFEPVLSAATKNLGNHIEIRIRDNGTGIPPEVKDKIFNPFFTTKPSGEGTGLGLSMSHDIIVKQHGGSIDVETEPGLFTEFKILLPRAGQR